MLVEYIFTNPGKLDKVFEYVEPREVHLPRKDEHIEITTMIGNEWVTHSGVVTLVRHIKDGIKPKKAVVFAALVAVTND